MKRCRPNLSAFLLLLLFVSAFVLIQMYANVDGDQGVVAVLAREDDIIDQYRLPHLSPINVVIGSKDRNRTQKSLTLFERYHLTDLQMLKPLEEPRPSFKLLIEPNITEDVPQRLSNQKIHSSMIIAIKSAYGNHNRRIAIRESWGGIQFFNGVRMEVVFVLALPESLEDKILANEESFKFGDILLVEMQENYRDVGYKVMASMQWAGDHFSDEWLFCSADDDILPNLPIMFSILQALILEAENSGRGLPMYCGFGFDESPGVLRSGKWMVPLSEYPYDHYPSICLGGFYSMTVKLTKAIYNASRHYPYFRHDDVFLTGFMRYVVCDSVGDEFHFAKSDPFCGISKVRNSKFEHVNPEDKQYKNLWSNLKNKILEDGSVILRRPSG